VRCLGNGRPFVLEVHESMLRLDSGSSSGVLNAIVTRINANEGLNSEGDVAVTALHPVSVVLAVSIIANTCYPSRRPN
jgi:tRNA U54 and U55 pseudouridine synthase Pus10